MFLEQVFNPIENRPTLSKEEIDASFDNFYGRGERPLTLPDDMSGQYNTQLTPDEESAYQAWAKGQGREKDVFNYDLRGAWKELQSGTMSEDERGHLGDKYKKPNHPTFSTESIYNGKDGYQGGVWSRNGNVDVYTPQHKLTPEQAKRLKLYFAQNEEGVALNLKDKVYDNPTIQLAPKSVGAFDGLAKGILYPIPNALVRMGSGALMVASKAMPWVRDDFLKQMEQASLDLDKWNRANFGANPETMGKATQVIHGLVGMLAELGVLTTGVGGAAGLAIKGVGAAEKLRKTSIAVGSALFGTDIGISERNRLVAEGVDEDTAFKAGAVSGLLNTIGAAIPPFLGSSRTWSAMYGAGSNVALNYAELSTISYVLDHQDYTELAKQYELNMVDMLVSAGVGAFMGTVFWRNPVDVKYDRAYQRVYERYKSDLEAGGKFSQEKIDSEAKINAASVVSYARMTHAAPDQVDDLAAKIVWTEDRKAFSVPEEYAMPFTQGNEWHMGPTKASPDEMIPVVFYKGQAPDRKTALAQIESFSSNGLKNEETGFVLSVSRSDLKKSFAGYNSYDERVLRAIAPIFDQVVAKAKLLESTPDLQHGNPHVQGIHIFGTPVGIDGGLYRVQLLVRDYVTPGQERLATHKVSGIKIYEIENPPVSRTDGGTSDIRGVTAPDIRLSGRPVATSDHAISLSQFVGGRKPYVRQDGKGLFDSVDDASRAEGGVYYESREYNQIIDDIETRYNEAVAKGDMVTAEALVKVYAMARGYTLNEDYRDSHSAPKASVAKEDFRNLDKLREEAKESGDVNLFAIANGVSIVPDDFFTYDGWWQYSNRNEAADSESFFKIRKAIDSIQNQIKKYGRVKHMPSVWVYRAVPKSVKEGSLQSDGQWVTPSRAYAKQHGQSRFGPGEYRIIKEPVPADSLWFNGDSINEWGFDNGEKYVYKNTTNNRKLYDAIVRDFDGNIVPLSKRFNSRKWEEFYQVGYHGTPYLFDAFTLAHIGSGEGAQAHGWGLYFALNKRIAEAYRERLAGARTYTYNGKSLHELYNELRREFQAELTKPTSSDKLAKLYLLTSKMSLLTSFTIGGKGNVKLEKNAPKSTQDAYKWLTEEVYPNLKLEKKGKVYTVEIPDDDVMLREEWKISNQNDAVKEAYRQYCKERFGYDNADVTSPYENGYDFYRSLTEWKGSPKEASLWLNKHGVKGIRYKGARDGECAVVWDEKSIKILEYLQKGQEGIRGAFNPSTNTIRLTPNANLSTFSHEHAHWYLTNTLALGGKEGAPLELQSQINAILHAFGIKSINDWNALGFEGQRKYQEQFAAWTEIYLTQGKSPVKELEGVFAKMAEWLIGMYKAALGKDAGPDAAVREVSDRYQAQFGEKLPELSPEVRKVLDTMYGAQQKRSAFKSSKAQAMAGRLVQAQRVNQTKVSAPISDPHGPTAGNVGQAAQGKAVSDLNNGRKVDVSEQVGDTEANVPVVEDTQSTFARGVSIGDGDNSRVVVLQNRNRSDPNSVAQMNSIASDPQYGRLSTSRTTQSGAPIVSFGHLPDKAYQGKSEIITESNGNKVPVTYYVVEADDVMRSNNYDGTPNKEWNNDNPDQMRAIAGNGRMAGLSEAYNRGTAEQYRQDLMADSENHGVSPETIKGMKKPVLVRYMPPDRVTTGFVERSNTSDVLVRSSLETAVQDSPKVRKNIGKYEFDEDGDPTKETLGQFLTDVGEVSEMGNLIDSNGNPTTAARARIKAAVFYEAYRDKRLTELVADSEDKHGIKRILSAMSAFAPHVIQIRETSGGAIDLAPIITDATHRILQARINGEGVDFTAQGDMFSSNPATEMMTNFLSQNRNSAAAMLRVLRPFAEQVENALQAADSPMFADLAVKTDLADAMALFRKAENQEIRNRSGDLLGDADGKLLPEIDVEAMRSSLANTLKDGKNLVDAISEGVAETNRMATPEAKAEAQQQHLIEQQNAREVLSENSEAVRARNFALEDPNRELVMTDENGNDVIVTAQDAMAKATEIDQDLNDSTAGLGMGVACIIRNQGIRKS